MTKHHCRNAIHVEQIFLGKDRRIPRQARNDGRDKKRRRRSVNVHTYLNICNLKVADGRACEAGSPVRCFGSRRGSKTLCKKRKKRNTKHKWERIALHLCLGIKEQRQKSKICGGFVDKRAGGVGGDGAVGGGCHELAYLFGAAVARGKYAFAGSDAAFVRDDVAF